MTGPRHKGELPRQQLPLTSIQSSRRLKLTSPISRTSGKKSNSKRSELNPRQPNPKEVKGGDADPARENASAVAPSHSELTARLGAVDRNVDECMAAAVENSVAAELSTLSSSRPVPIARWF